MTDEKSSFQTLFDVNVSEYTDERKGLTYLPWSHAMSEVLKIYPDTAYHIKWFGEKPYLYDPALGYMVFTDVTIEGLTREMWLPVLDTNNKAMKNEPYTYDTTSRKGIKVEAATMYDINKALMRCLVKNLAAHGLGMYIYNKDDLPEAVTKEREEYLKKVADAIEQVKSCGTAFVKAGFKKEDLYQIIADNNDGNKNPNDLVELEAAEKIIAEIKKRLGEKEAAQKKTTKSTTKKENA